MGWVGGWLLNARDEEYIRFRGQEVVRPSWISYSGPVAAVTSTGLHTQRSHTHTHTRILSDWCIKCMFLICQLSIFTVVCKYKYENKTTDKHRIMFSHFSVK